jgi:hypothetical protein
MIGGADRNARRNGAEPVLPGSFELLPALLQRFD